MRYLAVEREELRPLLTEDGSLADLLLSTFIRRREMLQQFDGVGVEVIGPRSAAGDVRSGSIKRCATAVGEGAAVVRFVHERLTEVPA